MRYCAFGLIVESDRPLPELPPATAANGPRRTIAWVADLGLPSELSWTPVWEPERRNPDVWFARANDACYLWLDGIASARIVGDVIEVAEHDGVDPAALRHRVLDEILPLALAFEGHMVLHASAVGVDGAAVLFVGPAGAGKSTLAAALASCGGEVLADDGVLMQMRGTDVWAVPSYPGLRLWADSAHIAGADFRPAPLGGTRSKQRFVPAARHSPAPRPVARVYSLHATGEAGRFVKLSRREAAIELVRHAFTPDSRDRSARLAQLDRAVCWSGRLDVWSVGAGRDVSEVQTFARAVVAHAGERPAASLTAPAI